MAANAPGLQVTAKHIEQWAAQTDLTSRQLEALGVKPGVLDESLIGKLSEIGDDAQSRRLVDFLDSTVFQNRSDRTSKGSQQVLISDVEPWRTLQTANQKFIADAVEIGGFDDNWVKELHTLLKVAVKQGFGAEQVTARNLVRVQLYDARQAAARRSRSYRQLAEVIRRETSGREMVKNIEIIVEISSRSRQLTIAPLSEIKMDCADSNAPTLLFRQTK